VEREETESGKGKSYDMASAKLVREFFSGIAGSRYGQKDQATFAKKYSI
jgi:hypothetical protein